jgi:hypothetical protein
MPLEAKNTSELLCQISRELLENVGHINQEIVGFQAAARLGQEEVEELEKNLKTSLEF